MDRYKQQNKVFSEKDRVSDRFIKDKSAISTYKINLADRK